MGHQETYRTNEAYSEFLASQEERFFAKYADTLRPARAGARALDIGCGVGQVLRRLEKAGTEAWGVEVSETSAASAKSRGLNVTCYDGHRLPFPEKHFASAGALNVLEHAEEPEAFVEELARVVELGGRIVLSSPNFFRVVGWRDYHPKMRGIGNKWRNWRRLQEKRHQIRTEPDKVRFDRMDPIVREIFQPDDDAIIATNPLEMAFFLQRVGCTVERIECTDRYVSKAIDVALNSTPLRMIMFNAFLVARRTG